MAVFGAAANRWGRRAPGCDATYIYRSPTGPPPTPPHASLSPALLFSPAITPPRHVSLTIFFSYHSKASLPLFPNYQNGYVSFELSPCLATPAHVCVSPSCLLLHTHVFQCPPTATMTMHARSYAPITSKPSISSPLAASGTPRPLHQRTNSSPAFPTSRPLRPFPSINTPLSKRSNGPAAKPVKIIEPPKNFRGEWVLNLTQAEFGRQD
ncbi:hypothetical protein EIP91_005051 [Steccherinum ochraceum]|uniref:Uncharacterized protein n=1 Tax=Steccherinum ochraceum TaxID=92696 RepID=A0A4R0RW57_9APHY|nr:hypothetical protein EIP91_005051 [Steccherinum ochraceum]